MAPQRRPAPVTDEQLDQAQTQEQLGALLRQAMGHAGLSLRGLEAAAKTAEAGREPRVGLTRTAVHDMVNGRYLTDPRVRSAVTLCGVPDAQMPKWLAAFYRVSEQPVVDAPTAVRPKAWHKPPRVRIGLAVGAVIVVVVGIGAFTWPRSGDDAPAAEAPLTVEAATVVRGACTTLVFDKAIGELGAPPKISADYGRWAWEHDGVEADPMGGHRAGRVELSMRGTSAIPVTITSVDAEIVERRPGPLAGIKVGGQCGSSTIGRLAEIDLDADPPKITGSNADPKKVWGQDVSTTPLRFPYQVSATDPELLLIIAEVHSNDTVSYRLHIGWTDGAHSGTKMIDNNGKPFRVGTADPKAPLYVASGARFSEIK
ncbi:helix-turn-helix transcriptional regulator [Nocardia sp. NPDC051463]|uniref:helix-turn-helix domain-containing protein n=1 Tax=Nocardia sp. NPDC051463 TaxID=3154845 RepID=UPI003433B18F